MNIIYSVVPGLQGDPTKFVPIVCMNAGDMNDDGRMNLADAIHVIDFQFRGGPAPKAPFPACGTTDQSDPTTCSPGSTSCGSGPDC